MFRERRFLGVATVDLKLEGLGEVAAEIGERVGGYGFILDRNHTFVTYPDPEVVRRSSGEETAGATGEFLNATEFAETQVGFEPIGLYHYSRL